MDRAPHFPPNCPRVLYVPGSPTQDIYRHNAGSGYADLHCARQYTHNGYGRHHRTRNGNGLLGKVRSFQITFFFKVFFGSSRFLGLFRNLDFFENPTGYILAGDLS